MYKQNVVYIHKSDTFDYPSAPFNPPQIFPELKDNLLFRLDIDKTNMIYNSIRDTLIGLELDSQNIGTQEWNPLKNFVKAGQSIVIKPNLVYHAHPLGESGVISTITNASLIRPLIDYVLLATNGYCKITICDVPLQSTDWGEVIRISGLKDLIEFYKYKNINIDLLDLRYEISRTNDVKIIVNREFKIRDPMGYVAVDLGAKSELMPIIKYCDKFEVTDYGSGTVPKHHNPEKNEYCISKTVLNCDFFINVPKLKTHRKAGLTCAMKNLVGINSDKSWIAHHRRGKKSCGGDEFKEIHMYIILKNGFFSFLKRHNSLIPLATVLKWFSNNVIHQGKNKNEGMKVNTYFIEGSWYGNDTLWRCIKDLNKIILYADKSGKMQDQIQRNYFCIVDGIIAGEKEGPMEQIPKNAGIIIGGTKAVYIDKVAADIMGFDYTKITQIKEGFNNKYWNLVDIDDRGIDLKSNIKEIGDLNLNFIPTSGWQYYINNTAHTK
jgi:uncharacterized protein (DUF362 family)